MDEKQIITTFIYIKNRHIANDCHPALRRLVSDRYKQFIH